MSEQRPNNNNNFPIFNPINHSDHHQDHEEINHDNKTRSEPNNTAGNGSSVRVSVSSDDDTGSEVDIVQEEQEEIT